MRPQLVPVDEVLVVSATAEFVRVRSCLVWYELAALTVREWVTDMGVPNSNGVSLCAIAQFSGPDRNSHYHELFVRDRPMLALKMYRVKVKGSGPRRPLSIVKVPDMTPLSKNHVTHYTAFPILAANTGGMVSIYNSGASTMQSTSSGGQPTDTSPLTFRLASSETTVIVPTNDAGDGPGIAWLFQCLHYQEQVQKEKRRRQKLGQLMRHLVHRHAQDRERCQQLENLVTQLLLAPRPSGVVGFGGETNQAQALAPIFYAAQPDSETH